MNVFIAGPRAISKLDNCVEERLKNIYAQNLNVFVGDASGVDKAVQDYFSKLNYKAVIIYASEGKPRNNLGNWAVKNIEVDKGLKGFEFYQQKDIAMANEADYGFMIWNGESKGTLNNIVNLLNNGKKVLLYLTPNKKFIILEDKLQLEDIIEACSEKIKKIYSSIERELLNKDMQIAMF